MKEILEGWSPALSPTTEHVDMHIVLASSSGCRAQTAVKAQAVWWMG